MVHIEKRALASPVNKGSFKKHEYRAIGNAFIITQINGFVKTEKSPY